MNKKEIYYEFSLDLPKSNLDTYYWLLQKMYQTILELDDKAVTIKYKTTTTTNKHRISIQAKEALLNFSEAIIKHLVYLHDYFLNRRPNEKRIYSKFWILYNKDIDKIILAVKDDMIDYKFYAKRQPLQYHGIICIE